LLNIAQKHAKPNEICLRIHLRDIAKYWPKYVKPIEYAYGFTHLDVNVIQK